MSIFGVVTRDDLDRVVQRLEARIDELSGMLARHKIVDERHPEMETKWAECGGGFTLPYQSPVADRRGRKT